MSEKEQRLPKALVARFQLDAQLGKGGMGAVFRGRMPETGKPCAVKIVRTAGHARHALRMQREAKLLSRVRHPNLVEIFDMGHEEGLPWIAMEYVDGGTMSRMRRRGQLADPDRVAELFLHVAAALEALHDEGITHRDIKLGNIMVDAQGRPVLMDLGLAVNEEATRITKTGQLVGTVTYLAPELFQGVPAGPVSDWWAIGICLYAILEDRYPYTQEQVYQMIGARVWQPPPEMVGPHRDHPLAQACRAMLAVDPAARLVSREDLRGVLRGAPWAPPRATLPSQPTGASIEMPGHPRTRGLVTGLGIFLIFLAGAALLRLRAPPSREVQVPSPVAPAALEPAPGVPAHALWRWAQARRQEVAESRKAQGDSQVARRLESSLARLAVARSPDPWFHMARLELLRGLAFDEPGRRVFLGWRDRLERARRDLGEALRGAGDAEMAELRRELEQLLERSQTFIDVAGLGPSAFPLRPPPRNLLWALRSFGPADLPRSVQEELLAFGLGLPPDLDLDDWAGDLRRHPVVAVARARRAGAWAQPAPEAVRARLVETADWTPGADSSEALWLLWIDHQVMAAVQMALAERPETRTAGVFAPHFRRRLEEARPGEDVLALGRAWAAWFEGFLAQGEYRRRLRPLREALPELRRLVARLDGPPPAGRPPGVHAVMRVVAGGLEVGFHYVLVECEELEVRLVATRGRTDWEALEGIGAGGLLEHWAPGKYEEVSRMGELCKATRATLGGPFQLVRFLDEEPRPGG